MLVLCLSQQLKANLRYLQVSGGWMYVDGGIRSVVCIEVIEQQKNGRDNAEW